MSDRILQSLGLLRAVNSEAGTVDAVISTGNLARDDAIILTRGWQLQNFRKNPVVLWSHESWEPPIGRILTVTKGKEDLTATIQMDMEDPRAVELFGKIERRFIHAMSVRWLPIETEFRDAEDGEGRILVFIKQELLEASFVSVPADPSALIQRGFSQDEIDRALTHVEGGETPWNVRSIIGCAVGDTDCQREQEHAGSPERIITALPADLARFQQSDYRTGSLDDPIAPVRGVLNLEAGDWTPLEGEKLQYERVEPQTSLHPQTTPNEPPAPDADGVLMALTDEHTLTSESTVAEHAAAHNATLRAHAHTARLIAVLAQRVNVAPPQVSNVTIEQLDFSGDSEDTRAALADLGTALGIEPRAADFEQRWESLPMADGIDPERLLAYGMLASVRQATAWNSALESYLAPGTNEEAYILADGLSDGERSEGVSLVWRVYGATVQQQHHSEANASLHDYLSTRGSTTEADGVLTASDEVAEQVSPVVARLEAVLVTNGDRPPRLTGAEQREVQDLAVSVSELLGGLPTDDLEPRLSEMSPSARTMIARFVAVMSQRQKSGESGAEDVTLIATLAELTGHTDDEVSALLAGTS